MKKIIIVLFFCTLIMLISKGEEVYIIPDNAIRLRVIANSNTFEDQKIKMEIKNNIEDILKNELLSVINKNDANNVINSKISEIENMINDYNVKFKINYGENYFPEKNYKGVKYEEGYYESLVVTLGTGYGDNWWCVLFPPLCLMEAKIDDNTDIDYGLFVKDIFNKYM